jgi:hypothetical protein
LHASSPRQERWQQLKETNPILRKVAALQEAYQESENPVVSSMRSVTSTVASWFDENETARVLRSMKTLDPSFSMESFERELREYIVPEVVDAYLSADNESLKSWCSEAVRPPNQRRRRVDFFFPSSRLTTYCGQRWSSISDRDSRPTRRFWTSGRWT